tara:strand:- start:5431 stop:5847 length:417 start_codon:yes stop_codon:yes gene_type:complete
MLAIGCSDNMSNQNSIEYEFTVETGLPLDGNGYYHFVMETYGTSQALTKFTVHTNNPITQFVYWDCDTQFDYQWQNQNFDVDIINHSSYTNDVGDAFTMFGPQISMVGDTVTIYVGYVDYEYDIEYSEYFYVILEIDE